MIWVDVGCVAAVWPSHCRLSGYHKRQHERALQIRDALLVAAREHYENVIYLVSPADDLERPSAIAVMDADE